MTQNKIVPPGTTEDTVKRGNSWQEITERKDCGNTEETGGSSSTD